MDYQNADIQQMNIPNGGLLGQDPADAGMNSYWQTRQNMNKMTLQNLNVNNAQLENQYNNYNQDARFASSDDAKAKSLSDIAQIPSQEALNISTNTSNRQQKFGTDRGQLMYDVAQATDPVTKAQLFNDGMARLKQAYPDLVPDQTPHYNPQTAARLEPLISVYAKNAVNTPSHLQARDLQELRNTGELNVAQEHTTGQVHSSQIAANAAITDSNTRAKSAKEVAEIEAQAKRDVSMQQVQKTIEALSPDKAAVHFIMQAAKEKRPLNEYEQAAIESVKADKINQAATQIAGSPAFMSRIMQAQQSNDSNAMNQIYAQINDLAKRQATVGYEKLFNYGNPASKAQPAPQPKAPAGGDGWSIVKH